jgi:hypothetical protein
MTQFAIMVVIVGIITLTCLKGSVGNVAKTK